MLVLSRRLQETVVIGADIRVTVIKTGTGAVRLGIEAPDDVPVHREEIHRRILAADPAPAPVTWENRWRLDSERAN